MLIPVVTAPAAPTVLDEVIMMLLDAVGPEDAAQEAAVGSVTLALYLLPISTRPHGRPWKPRKEHGLGQQVD